MENSLHILNKQGLFREEQINKLNQCERCIMGTQYKLSFKLGSHNSKDVLEYIHDDLWGLEQATTVGGLFKKDLDSSFKTQI